MAQINLDDNLSVALVDQIQAANPTADVAAIEAEIDQLVYQLYGLTDKEIKIVEGGTK